MTGDNGDVIGFPGRKPPRTDEEKYEAAVSEQTGEKTEAHVLILDHLIKGGKCPPDLSDMVVAGLNLPLMVAFERAMRANPDTPAEEWWKALRMFAWKKQGWGIAP